MTFLPRAASAAALGALAAPLLAVLPTTLAVPAADAAAVPCRTTPAASARETPPWRRHVDTTDVTQADLAALPADQTARRYVAREIEPVLPSHVQIPVYVHVIKGTHKGERNPVGRKRIVRVIQVLNNGMAGNQNQLSAAARYRFHLVKIDYTKREGWYHAFFNGPRDQRMKRKLHRGNAHTLNLYVNGGGPQGEPVLGWSRFPWQYAAAPKLDGVSVNAASLPGGIATGYNLGDTVIHETGHWLGLLHTFQGGCGGRGDLVSDTPAEAEPSFYCETTRDTCSAPGLDPVRNFMDYSLDSCMNMFTAGQVRRMDSAFEKWRLRG